MEKVIALSATNNETSTKTLNILIDMLMMVSDSFEIRRNCESFATFQFNHKKISVCTCGNSEKHITDNIDYFKEKKCTIAVSATRTRGGSKEEYVAFGKENNSEVLGIHKDDNLNSCRLYAAKLFQLVTDGIDIETENFQEN